jgi:HD-like signal output (HDOD) protein/CheY-like chemotaxis protein
MSSGEAASVMTGTVMFVDDERNIIRAIERAFGHGDINILTAVSAENALEILEREQVDIVISDYRMPRTDGLSLLAKIRDLHPSVHRIVLSGYVDEPEIFRSLSSGLATTFFAKPWDEKQIKDRIHHILEIRSVLRHHRLLNLINSVLSLPTLPMLYLELVAQIENDRAIDEIVRTVEKDPTVTTMILHVANSAFYGTARDQQITGLKEAILNLGLIQVKDIVLAVSLINRSEWNSKQLQYIVEIFVHSFLMNAYLPNIHQRLTGEILHRQFSSVGLIHDIGKIILLEYFPERFKQICNAMGHGGCTGFREAELSLGMEGGTHSEIGAYFLDWWNMPDVLTECTLFHHEPEKATSYPDVVRSLAYTNELMNFLAVHRQKASLDLSRFVRHSVPEEFLERVSETVRRSVDESIKALRRSLSREQ